MSYIAYQNAPVLRTDWRVIAIEWRDAAHATPDNAGSGNTVLEGGTPKAPLSVANARPGWYVNLTDNSIAADLPEDTSAEAQRAEIESIARESFGQFHATLFDDAQVQVVRKFFRNVLVYNAAATEDNDLDKIKATARTNADDLALYSNTTAWGTGLDTAGLRTFVKPGTPTPNSVALPAAETLTVTRTAQQLTAGNLAALLL